MSRKHFELIAATLREAADGSDAATVSVAHLADLFAAELARQNPRFNRERFLKACGC